MKASAIPVEALRYLTTREVIMRWFSTSLAGLLAVGGVSASLAAEPGVSAEVNQIVQQMGKALSQENLAFKAKTLRVYEDKDGDFLHIGHNMNVQVRRPDHVAIVSNGDDGTTKFVYDGKQAAVLDVADNRYVQVPFTGDLQAMFEAVSQRTGHDTPLADLLSGDPAKSFMSGVIAAKQAGTDTIDGVKTKHLHLTQAGAAEMELWVDDNNLPRRLIITYRSLPGTPNFIAEFSDWNFTNRPADAAFTFQPPAGATKVDIPSSSEKKP